MKLTAEQIENWVANNFTKYKRRSYGRQLCINNPFDDDDDYHCWISTVETPLKKRDELGREIKGFWVHDFRPGNHEVGCSFFKFVSKFKGISYYEAVQEVTGHSKADLQQIFRSYRRQLRKGSEPEEEEIPEGTITLPSLSKPLSDISDTSKLKTIALNYIHGRAIPDDIIARYQIAYTPSTLVFPYIEYGTIVFWQEREIMNKRFNFPDEGKTGLKKTDYIYGFDDIEPGTILIVVESIFNKLSVGVECVATGGATIVGRQVQKLKALAPKQIILAPDADEAGYQSVIDNYFLLKNDFKLSYCIPPKDKDWNDLDREFGVGTAYKYITKHTINLTLAVIIQLKSKVAQMKKVKNRPVFS